MFEGLVEATLLLFAVVNPIGSIPLFAQLTGSMPADTRRRTFRIAVITGLTISVVFCLVGNWIFTDLFHLEKWDIMIAGGLLLVLIAMDHLVFGFLERRVIESTGTSEIGAVPIACPILIGPGAILTIILNVESFGLPVALLSVAIIFVMILLIFRFLDSLCKLMGQIGSIVVSKLFLLFLAGVGVKFLVKGIMGYSMSMMVWP